MSPQSDREIPGEAGAITLGRLDPGQASREAWTSWLRSPQRRWLAFGAIALISILLATFLVNFRGKPYMARPELEANVRERIEHYVKLATLLATVENPDQARSISTPANREISLITVNLKKLKAIHGRESDIEALKQRYRDDQEQVEKRVVAEILRVAAISDAWKALKIQEALEELGREEKTIPDREPVAP